MRNVTCTPNGILEFHTQNHTYNCAFEAITASFGRIYGMRHGMCPGRQGELERGCRTGRSIAWVVWDPARPAGGGSSAAPSPGPPPRSQSGVSRLLSSRCPISPQKYKSHRERFTKAGQRITRTTVTLRALHAVE